MPAAGRMGAGRSQEFARSFVDMTRQDDEEVQRSAPKESSPAARQQDQTASASADEPAAGERAKPSAPASAKQPPSAKPRLTHGKSSRTVDPAPAGDANKNDAKVLPVAIFQPVAVELPEGTPLPAGQAASDQPAQTPGAEKLQPAAANPAPQLLDTALAFSARVTALAGEWPVPVQTSAVPAAPPAQSPAVSSAAIVAAAAAPKTAGSPAKQLTAQLAAPEAASPERAALSDAIAAATHSEGQQQSGMQSGSGRMPEPAVKEPSGSRDLRSETGVVSLQPPMNSGARAPASPSKGPAPAQPGSASLDTRTEPAAQPEAQRIRDISIKLGDGREERVDVHLQERAGEVRVAVRAADADLRRDLREGVSELAGRLEHSGYRLETQRSSESGSSPWNERHRQEGRHSAFAQGDRRGRQQPDSRQWMEAMQTTLRAGNEIRKEQ